MLPVVWRICVPPGTAARSDPRQHAHIINEYAPGNRPAFADNATQPDVNGIAQRFSCTQPSIAVMGKMGLLEIGHPYIERCNFLGMLASIILLPRL